MKSFFLSHRMLIIKTNEKMEIISLEKFIQKIAPNQNKKASPQSFCG